METDLEAFLHDFLPEIIPCKRDRIVVEESINKWQDYVPWKPSYRGEEPPF